MGRSGKLDALLVLVLAAALLGVGVQVAEGLRSFRSADRSVLIKGLAEQDVDSDFAVWTLSFRRAGDSFGSVQHLLSADRAQVLDFLREAGFETAELRVLPLQVQDAWSREYGARDQPLRFSGTGEVQVQSARVAHVQQVALAVDPLIKLGIQLNTGAGPRYQLRAFNTHKGPLLAEATRNARAQALAFAEQAGAELGPLRRANQGVIQISGSDGQGWDDGTSLRKRLRVVSTFEYALR